MGNSTVAVCIPHVPVGERRKTLADALASVIIQSRSPEEIIVIADTEHTGPAMTRNRTWIAAQSEYIAFLDDDDWFLEDHLEQLMRAARITGADLVYPWFHVSGGVDPLAAPHEGMLVRGCGVAFGEEQKQHVLELANFIPITYLVRRTLLEEVGGFPMPWSARWQHAQNEDWGFLQDALRAGAKLCHVPKETWVWRHWGHNFSGRTW